MTARSGLFCLYRRKMLYQRVNKKKQANKNKQTNKKTKKTKNKHKTNSHNYTRLGLCKTMRIKPCTPTTKKHGTVNGGYGDAKYSLYVILMTYNSCRDQFKWSIVTFTLNRLQDGRPLYVQSNGTKKRENGCKMLLR